MDRNELGKIALDAAFGEAGFTKESDSQWNENPFKRSWEAGAAAVYRKAIEDAEEALDFVDMNDPNGYYESKPEFREAVRAKLRGLLDD